MNIRDLEYLVALAEHQHFRKAAEACFVSQPTLSGQIKKLEDSLGVVLIERTSRKVIFTDTGYQLVRQAQKILLEVKILQEIANQQKQDMSGAIQIGVIPTVGPYLLPFIIPVLKEQFPLLEIFLYEAQTHVLVQQLNEGKLDCILLASVKETEHLIEIPLYQEAMIFALYPEHPWAALKEIPLSLLEGETVLILGDGHCFRDQALDVCFAEGAFEDARFRATSLETLRNMVAAKTGITILPELAIAKESHREDLVYRHIHGKVPQRLISLAYRPGSPLKHRYERISTAIEETINSIIRKR